MTRSILSGVPFVLLSLLAPDAGAPAGGGSAPADKPGDKPADKPTEEKPDEAPAAPAPAAPAAAASQPVKPSIFARAASMLKPQSELLGTISAHEATIAGHVATISAKDSEIAGLKAQLSEAQTGMAELEATMEEVAGKKAVDLAAAQGVPAVPTKPATAGATDTDEIASLREQASGESDPIKRANLHAKADRLADNKRNAANQ